MDSLPCGCSEAGPCGTHGPQEDIRPTLSKGSKVYIDGFSGLIAGVVVEMVSRHSSEYTGIQFPTGATVKVTSRTGRGYVRGEFVTRPVSMVVPRECIRRRKYGTRILPYNVVV